MPENGARQFQIGKAMVFALATLLCVSSIAHETDQYTLPDGRQFADRGPALSRYFYNAIERGVEKQNAAIRDAIKNHRSESEIAALQSEDQIVSAVNGQFPYAITFIEDLDRELDSPALAQKYPGFLPGYRPPFSFQQYWLFPMNPLRAWYAGTIYVYGSYVGNDKIGHFSDMGMHYYQAYSEVKRHGGSEQAAVARAIQCGTTDPMTSESGLLGFWTAGDYSNADLVSNFTGFLFYRNLVEPIMLKGELRQPMLARDGPLWTIAPAIQNDPDFFRWFISDHLDEAMNPGLFVPGMRDGMRAMAVNNSSSVLDHRTDANGERHSQQWFARELNDLSSYYGFDYGHRGDAELITISRDCFAPPPGDIHARNRQGRTALHCAVAAGDAQRVRELIAAGADVNAPIRSAEKYSPDEGETPLHLAACDGRDDLVKILLDAGADVNARSNRGVTALHRAVDSDSVIALLVDHGAKVDSPDVTRRTPLHWAARAGDLAAISILIDRGAKLDARDYRGRSALFDAVASGDRAAVDALLKRGANASLADRFNITALHEAARLRSPQSRAIVLALLSDGKVQPDLRDDFGCTPLYEAVRSDNRIAVATLLSAGADPSIADDYGIAPLQIAHADNALADLLRTALPASSRR